MTTQDNVALEPMVLERTAYPEFKANLHTHSGNWEFSFDIIVTGHPGQGEIRPFVVERGNEAIQFNKLDIIRLSNPDDLALRRIEGLLKRVLGMTEAERKHIEIGRASCRERG